MRFQSRYIILVIALSVTIGGLISLFAGKLMYQSMKEQLLEKGSIISVTLSDHITEEVIHRDIIHIREVIKRLIDHSEDIIYIYVIDFDGRLFAHSFPSDIPKGLLLDAENQFDTSPSFIKSYLINNMPVTGIRHPLIAGMPASINLGLNETVMLTDIKSLHFRILMITAVITLLSVVSGIILTRYLTSPLTELTAAVREYGKGMSKINIDIRAKCSEVSMLIDSFNQMIADKEAAKHEREKLIKELQESLSTVKKLSGMLPICSSCQKIRDDKGYWQKVADYISEHSEVEFTHGMCPECYKEYYLKYLKK